MTSIASRTFIAECYLPGVDRRGVEAAGLRARDAARELLRRGTPIEYLSTVFVPGDEAAYHVFASEDEAAVRDAAGLANLNCERVVESVEISVDGAALGRHEKGATR